MGRRPPRPLFVRFVGLMYANSPNLDDPQAPRNVFLSQARQQLPSKRRYGLDGRLVGWAQYGDPGRWFGRETKNVTEIEIERDKAPLFFSAHIIDRLIGRAAEALVVNAGNIVTGLA